MKRSEMTPDQRFQQKKRMLARTYGLSYDRYIALLEGQDFLCAICRCQPVVKDKDQKFCVDHCHTTGKVRGILCDRCNKGIGFFRDDPDAIRRAAMYVVARCG